MSKQQIKSMDEADVRELADIAFMLCWLLIDARKRAGEEPVQVRAEIEKYMDRIVELLAKVET